MKTLPTCIPGVQLAHQVSCRKSDGSILTLRSLRGTGMTPEHCQLLTAESGFTAQPSFAHGQMRPVHHLPSRRSLRGGGRCATG